MGGGGGGGMPRVINVQTPPHPQETQGDTPPIECHTASNNCPLGPSSLAWRCCTSARRSHLTEVAALVRATPVPVCCGVLGVVVGNGVGRRPSHRGVAGGPNPGTPKQDPEIAPRTRRTDVHIALHELGRGAPARDDGDARVGDAGLLVVAPLGRGGDEEELVGGCVGVCCGCVVVWVGSLRRVMSSSSSCSPG